ncbi:MAG TPA: WD40 repeat domain-containing protein [Capsulimonadaceae bacterium]|jgi:WD40 repeat protein
MLRLRVVISILVLLYLSSAAYAVDDGGLAWSLDSKHLAVSYDGRVRWLNVDAGAKSTDIVATGLDGVSIVATPSNQPLLAVSARDRVHIVSVGRLSWKANRYQADWPIYGLAWSSDGTMLGLRTNGVIVLTKTGAKGCEIVPTERHWSTDMPPVADAISWRPGRHEIAIARWGEVWIIRAGALRGKFTLRLAGRKMTRCLARPNTRFETVAWNDSADLLAATDGLGGNVYIVRYGKRVRMESVVRHPGVTDAFWTPNSDLVTIGDTELCVWSRKGVRKRTIQIPQHGYQEPVVGNSRSRLAIATQDERAGTTLISVWSADLRKKLLQLNCRGLVTEVQWSTASKRLAALTTGGSVYIWTIQDRGVSLKHHTL